METPVVEPSVSVPHDLFVALVQEAEVGYLGFADDSRLWERIEVDDVAALRAEVYADRPHLVTRFAKSQTSHGVMFQDSRGEVLACDQGYVRTSGGPSHAEWHAQRQSA